MHTIDRKNLKLGLKIEGVCKGKRIDWLGGCGLRKWERYGRADVYWSLLGD